MDGTMQATAVTIDLATGDCQIGGCRERKNFNALSKRLGMPLHLPALIGTEIYLTGGTSFKLVYPPPRRSQPLKKAGRQRKAGKKTASRVRRSGV